MMQDFSAGRHGPSLVIYGLARNVAPGLAADLAVIDDIQRSVPGSISIIVTNDNNDETATILQAWSGRDPARELIVPNGISAAVPDRIDRMAVLRNLALARVREVRRPHHTHLLVLDMDGPNRLISGNGISDLLAGWRPEWDAVFANQRPITTFMRSATRPGARPTAWLSSRMSPTASFSGRTSAGRWPR